MAIRLPRWVLPAAGGLFSLVVGILFSEDSEALKSRMCFASAGFICSPSASPSESAKSKPANSLAATPSADANGSLIASPDNGPAIPNSAEAIIPQIAQTASLTADTASNKVRVMVRVETRITNTLAFPIYLMWDNLHDSEFQIAGGWRLDRSNGSATQPKGLVACRSDGARCWTAYKHQFVRAEPGQVILATTYYGNLFPIADMDRLGAAKRGSFIASLLVAKDDSATPQRLPVSTDNLAIENSLGQ